MKRLTLILLVLVLGAARAQELPQDSQPTLSWLKGLVLEARFQLQLEGQFDEVRLFNELQPDGRSWFQVLADELGGAADWAIADEAVMLMLGEADAMRTLAIEHAGTAEQAAFMNARRAYLEAAALLLGEFQTAANTVYDNTLGLVPDVDLPDWILPGEIHIVEAAGAARLNVDTLEFGGRLSGEVRLPKFDATLVVPNASFDSRGNLDLSAYGSASFPDDGPDKVTLSLLERRPLSLSVSETGAIRASGAGRVSLPGGNTFEAYFDANDPNYEFGLAYSGTLTLEMADKLTLLRPTFATDLTPEAIQAMAEFFGRFGRGLEPLLGEAHLPNSLQELNAGVAPDFAPIPTSVPLDVVDAWVVAVEEESVRNALSAPLVDSLAGVRGILRGLEGELRNARTGIAPSLNEVKRLRRHAEKHAEVVEAIKASEAALEDGDKERASELLVDAGVPAEQARDAALEYFQGLPQDASLERVLESLRFLLAADRAATVLSTEGDSTLLADAQVVSQVEAKLVAARTQLLLENGLGSDGATVNAAKADALTPANLRVLLEVSILIDRTTAVFTLDDSNGLDSPPITTLANREFERTQALYNQAITEGDEASRTLYAVRLTDLGALHAIVPFAESTDDEVFMVRALYDTVQAIQGGAAVTGESRKRATRQVEAARKAYAKEKKATSERIDDLTGRDKNHLRPQDIVFDAPEKSFFERWYLAITAAEEAGVVDDDLAGDIKQDLGSVMQAFAEAQAERFSDGAMVETNLSEAYDALLILSDLVALAEEALPDNDDLQGAIDGVWEPLHLLWIEDAETYAMHRQLSVYAQTVAFGSARYGDGVGDRLDDFQNRAMAALDALALTVDGLSGALDDLLPESFQFALPGDLQVQRMFGSLRFNRLTGAWDVDFGGSLLFADYDLTFDVPGASLASDGEFELTLETMGPVPFGFADTLTLNTSFLFEGNALTPSLEQVNLGGELFYTPEGGTPLPPYTVMGTYNFQDPPGSHQFTFDATLPGPQEFFTKEIIITDTTVNLALSTDANGIPSQGGAGGDMTLWLLLREESADKEVSALTEDDFYLTFRGAAGFEYINTDDAHYFEVELTSGMFTLPGGLFADANNTSLPPSGSLLGTICVRYNLENGEILFCDPEGNEAPGIAFNNFVFPIPGLDGGELNIATAALRFPFDQPLPLLEELTADITLPIPGQDTTQEDDLTTVTVNVINWPITGLPEEVAIGLGESLTLFSFEQFQVRVLANAGEEWEDCPGGLSFLYNEDTGQTEFRIASGIEVTIDPEMVQRDPEDPMAETEGTTLTTSANGCFTWEVGQLPTFALGTITFGGRFRIGGENGIEFKGADGASEASISFQNVNNLFHRPPDDVTQAFRIELQGAVNFSNIIEFALLDSAFVWDGTTVNPLTNQIDNFLPRFEPGGVCAVLGEDGIDLIEGLLPLYPTELCLRFRDRTLSMFPTGNNLGLFDPTNLIVEASGVVTLPNGAAVDGGSPGISGAVQGVAIQFLRDPATDFPYPDFPATIGSIDSLTLRVENLDIPPLGGITGGLHLGNLDKALTEPEQLFFAGEVGAKVNDIGASVLLAAKPLEFVGACFALSAGPAGIPIDGGTLGGILLTGGSGGINFKNNFSDPCDFESYITFAQNDDGDTVAATPDENFPPMDARGESPPDVDDLNREIMEDPEGEYSVSQEESLPPQVPCILPTTPDFNCITGDFPPSTVNPLCEIITIAGEDRVIFMGTALERAQVEALLADLSPDGMDLKTYLDSLSPGMIIDLFVEKIRDDFEQGIYRPTLVAYGLNPDPPGPNDPPEPRALQFFRNKMTELFDSLEDSAKHFMREGFHKALSSPNADPDQSLFEILVAKAAEGIPCFDVTLQVSGTLSHSAISSVLSGTGKVTVSTTGTSVLQGTINLVGIPVGDATLAFSLTNQSGDIDPSFGGVAEVALGPLELGRLTMSLGCPGCFEAVQEALLEWIVTNANAFASTAEGSLGHFLIRMMDTAAPRYDLNTGLLTARTISAAMDVEFHFLDMTEEERFAWMSSFLNFFQIIVDNANKPAGESLDFLPVSANDQLINTFLASFETLLVGILTRVEPRVCFGGDVGPKIFGIPLTGGAESQVGGGLLYHTVTDLNDSNDPDDDVKYQEVVSQFSFSPSQLLASTVMGSYAFSFPTAADQAQMGYSLRMPAFTEENIGTLLMNPAQFAADQITTLIEDGVLSFGYQIQPLGYQLGNGQGRMIMPRLTEHPLNPNRSNRRLDNLLGITPAGTEDPKEWINPDDYNDPRIPTRMEIILAALSKGQMQNPLWRGQPEDLASLFALAGSDCYQPSTAGCDLLTQCVAQRIDPAILGQLDLAEDYFPHGGFIGGADLALPNVVAKPVPFDRLAQLLTLPLDGDFQPWLDNACILFGDPSAPINDPKRQDPAYAYFTGTQCTGQMALYLPAPNPLGFDWANGSLEEFLQMVNSGDLLGIVDRTLPEEIYPADLILLRGWMETPILGLPVASAIVEYDPDAGCFLATAQVGNRTQDAAPMGCMAEEELESNWLADMVGASVTFQIKAPDGVQAMADPLDENVDDLTDAEILSRRMDEVQVGGITDQMMALGATLESLDSANLSDDDVLALIDDFRNSMPKVGLEAEANFQVPPALKDLMKTTVDAETTFFAFSPNFVTPGSEADDPNDDSPYAVAKRRGGWGIKSSFQLGYFPENLRRDDHLIIDVPDASFAMIPDADVGLFPAITGQGVFTNIQIPGPVAFQGSGEIQFSSSPAVGQDYIQLDGETAPIDFGAFLQVHPLEENDDTIGAMLKVTRTETGAGIGLAIQPARAEIPLFGSLNGKIFGGELNHDSDRDTLSDAIAELDDTLPFTFSSYAGEEWSALVQLDGALEIRSPFDPEGEVFFAAAPAIDEGTGAQVPFIAALNGTGLDEFEIRLTIPNGLTFTLFPEQPYASTYQVGDNSATCLIVKSSGEFYFDSGTRTLNLANGMGEIQGRLEFGFQPAGADSIFTYTDPIAVAAPLGSANDQTIRITNRQTAPSQLIVDASLTDSTHFTVFPSRVILGARESADLTLRFRPTAVDFEAPSLRLESNADPAVVEIPLEGVTRAVPRVHVHLTEIRFGRTPLGNSKTQVLRVHNVGTGILECDNVMTDLDAFSVDTTNFTVAPNQSRELFVTYDPSSTQTQTATLQFDTNDRVTPRAQVKLSGNGSDRFWMQQRRGDGQASLQGIAMRSDGRGHAVGWTGTHFSGSASGQTWSQDNFSGQPDLAGTTAVTTQTVWAVGSTRPVKGAFEAYAARTTNAGANWARQTTPALTADGTRWNAVGVIATTNRVTFVGGQVSGAARITVQNGTNAYLVPELDEKAATLHGVAFGTATRGIAVGEKSTLLRTADGGKTWDLLTNFPKDFTPGVTFYAVAANPFDPKRYVVVGEDGTIIGTGDDGDTWALVKTGVSEDLHGVVRAGNNRYFAVGDHGRVLVGNASGTGWVVEDAGTSESFRSLTALGLGTAQVGPHVWGTTEDGSIFYRSPTALSGPVAVIEADDLSIRAAIGERVVREVTISNEGTEPLAIETIVSGEGIEVDPKGAQTIAPGETITVRVVIIPKTDGLLPGQITFSSSDPALDKEALDIFIEVRDPEFLPLGHVVLPPFLDLGVVTVGDTARRRITVQNLGQVPINVHGVDVRHAYPEARYTATLGSEEAIKSAEFLTVSLTADAAGDYAGWLELASDAANGVATMEVVARVVEPPNTITVRTSPPGLPFRLDHDGDGTLSNYSDTTVFTVVEGNPATPFQLREGQSIEVEAAESGRLGGVFWEFRQWLPDVPRTFSFTAGASANEWVAEFVSRPGAARPPGDPPLLVASPCAFEPPVDVSFGPWVRITDARMSLPWLDDGEDAGFEIEGALFMSRDRVFASLTSSRVVVVEPAFQNLELLEITPGSWNLDIVAEENQGIFSLDALTPGLEVLNASLSPPSLLHLEVKLTETTRRAELSLETQNVLPLYPGLLALGPGDLEFETNIGSEDAQIRFALDGSLLGLPHPFIDGVWFINRPYDFELASEITPVEFTQRTQLADVGLARLYADQGSVIRPKLDGASLGLEATGLDLELFRSETFLPIDVEADAVSGFSLVSDLPFNGVNAGPVTVKPSTDADTEIVLEANPLVGHLLFSAPPLTFDSTAGLWPNNTVRTPGDERLGFNTSNLTVRLPLPGGNFEFAGFEMPNDPNRGADHYIEFSRTAQSGRVKLRNQMDLFLGRLKFGFEAEATSSGGVDLSGSLSGEIGVSQAPLNNFSDSVSMSYRKDGNPEFRAHRSVLGVGIRFKVGSGDPIEAGFCTLNNGSPEPISDWSENNCFP